MAIALLPMGVVAEGVIMDGVCPVLGVIPPGVIPEGVAPAGVACPGVGVAEGPPPGVAEGVSSHLERLLLAPGVGVSEMILSAPPCVSVRGVSAQPAP